MRNYIPDELTVERRLETATHSSFPGGGATASVYKLTEEANAYIKNTPDYLSRWRDQDGGCGSAFVFLRDIGNGKDQKIRRHMPGGRAVYSQKNAILLPDEGLIITCIANW